MNSALATAVFLLASTQCCQAASACDLNLDGKVDASDVFAAITMALDVAPCTANIVGAGVCNIVVIQRVINAELSGRCVTDATTANTTTINGTTAHSVSLNWTASASNVAGYYVYRGIQTGGPYAKVTSSFVVGTTYADAAVQSGQTYYYVVTAVDAAGNESSYSNQAAAVVPYP